MAILQKWIGYGIALAGWLIIASAFLYSLAHSPVTIPWYVFYIAASTALLLIVINPRINTASISIPNRWFLIAVTILFIMSRAIWIAYVPTQPFSDFQSYDWLAKAFSTGHPIEGNLDIGIKIMSWGYPTILGGLYFLFGHSLLVAKIFNIVLGLGSMLVIFWIAQQLASSGLAKITTLIFLFWPSQLMMTSVLASEHLALLLVTLVIALTIRVLSSPDRWVVKAVLLGLTLALAILARSALVALFLTSLFAIFLFKEKGKIKTMLVVVTSLIIFYAAYLGGLWMIYHQVPEPGIFDSLLKGVNITSNGEWNEEDAINFVSSESLAQANQKAWREIVRRITADPLGEIKLFLRKPLLNWGNETYATLWSTTSLEDTCKNCWNSRLTDIWNLIAQTYHELLLGFGAMGFFLLYRTPAPKWGAGIWLAAIYLVLGTGMHMVLEFQPRYHYVMEPALMLVVMEGIKNSSLLNRPES